MGCYCFYCAIWDSDGNKNKWENNSPLVAPRNIEVVQAKGLILTQEDRWKRLKKKSRISSIVFIGKKARSLKNWQIINFYMFREEETEKEMTHQDSIEKKSLVLRV